MHIFKLYYRAWPPQYNLGRTVEILVRFNLNCQKFFLFTKGDDVLNSLEEDMHVIR